MATITAGGVVIAPSLVTDVSSERVAGTIVHPILGRSSPDVTLRPAGLRTGTLEALFAGVGSEAASKAAEDALAVGVLCTLAAPERPTLPTSFVVGGRITRTLDPDTRDAWIITVEYQEVTP